MRSYTCCIWHLCLIGIGSLFFTAPSGKCESSLETTTEISGKFDQIALNSNGRSNGIILQDHTVLRFRPGSLSTSINLTPGDVITAKGHLVLSGPNKVLHQVVVKKNNRTIVDDKNYTGPSFSEVTFSRFKSFHDSSTLTAVSARKDGKIDALIFPNGIQVHLPNNSSIETQKLQIGQKIEIKGIARSFPNGKYIEAMNLQNSEDPTSVLFVSEKKGESWSYKEGIVKHFLLTPSGQVNGLILSDNTAIKFPSVPSDRLSQLTKGSVVQAAGLNYGNQTLTSFLVMPQQNLVIEIGTDRSRLGNQLAGRMGSSSDRRSSLVPLRERSQIQSVLRNPEGNIETILLNNGTTVKVSPRVQKQIPIQLKTGDAIAINGKGKKYSEGQSIEADSIQIVSLA